VRVRLARGKPRRLPREDPRAEVSEEVRVGVGVRVGPVEFNVVLTPQVHSCVKFVGLPLATCGITVLYNCLLWYKYMFTEQWAWSTA